jgi:CheY-like chemotaxis protein
MEIKSILLAEDSPQDVEMTIAALKEHSLPGHVVVVSDGVKALDYLYSRGEYENRSPGNPALVLLDLNMPKVGGLEVLQTIKTDAALKRIPVIMLTSSREERDLVQSYANGANAYVVKPANFRQFSEAVRQLGAFWTVRNELPPAPHKTSPPG